MTGASFNRRMPARRAILVLALAAALAGCGGGGSSPSSDPSSKDYDPAHTTLQKAGLEVCSEGQHEVGAQLSQLPGVAATRVFDVAKSCNGATRTPNVITVFQFTNKDDFTSGARKIKAALPNSAVLEHYPLVIASSGPNAEANLEAVKQQLPPTAS
jgi:hypothetical protein